MHLHAKIPLLALSGLMHLRVTTLLLVLGRARSMNDAGIHHGTLGYEQSLILEVGVDFIQQYHRQIVLLQQMPEVQYRGLVRQGVSNTTETSKAAHALDLVQGIFHLPVR